MALPGEKNIETERKEPITNSTSKLYSKDVNFK